MRNDLRLRFKEVAIFGRILKPGRFPAPDPVPHQADPKMPTPLALLTLQDMWVLYPVLD